MVKAGILKQIKNQIMIRDVLKGKLKKALKEAGYKKIEPEVLPTADPKFGDYYSNIALKLAKLGTKQSISKVAKSLQAKLPKSEGVFTSEIAPNGFINFKFSNQFLQSQVQKIIEAGSDFGCVETGKGKKVQVEFISANPTGPLTLGNGRGGFTGDALANCLEKAGYQVEREYYINDTGNQIKILGLSILDVLGVKAEKREDLYKGEYIVEISKKIEKKIDVESYKNEPSEIGEIAAEIALEEYIKPALKKMNIAFDKFVSEKSLHERGEIKAALNELEKKGLTIEKEGAIWFTPKKGSSASVQETDRVLVRSEKAGGKAPTYFLADIAYHINKFNRGFDNVIDIWGADHAGYVPRMQLVAVELGSGEKLEIIIIQLVRLIEEGREVRMSKRTGTFITLEELVAETGLDVARFFFISRSPNTHLDFDLKLAKEVSNKNPVYYVQYAHARCNSLLKKAQKEGFSLVNLSKVGVSLLNKPEELVLIRHLIKLPQLVEDIADNHAVHLLTTYTIQLADKFHRFYERVRVISEDKQLSAARLSLILATKITLHNSLGLMGISAPKYMEKVGKEDEPKTS